MRHIAQSAAEHARLDREDAERRLRGMLATAEIPVRPSYSSEEVCTLLQISERTFKRLIRGYYPPHSPHWVPWGMASLRTALGIRVPFVDLVTWLDDNTEWKRAACA